MPCPICGQPAAGTKRRVFCSQRCRQKAFRDRAAGKVDRRVAEALAQLEPPAEVRLQHFRNNVGRRDRAAEGLRKAIASMNAIDRMVNGPKGNQVQARDLNKAMQAVLNGALEAIAPLVDAPSGSQKRSRLADMERLPGHPELARRLDSFWREVLLADSR